MALEDTGAGFGGGEGEACGEVGAPVRGEAVARPEGMTMSFPRAAKTQAAMVAAVKSEGAARLGEMPISFKDVAFQKCLMELQWTQSPSRSLTREIL